MWRRAVSVQQLARSYPKRKWCNFYSRITYLNAVYRNLFLHHVKDFKVIVHASIFDISVIFQHLLVSVNLNIIRRSHSKIISLIVAKLHLDLQIMFVRTVKRKRNFLLSFRYKSLMNTYLYKINQFQKATTVLTGYKPI